MGFARGTVVGTICMHHVLLASIVVGHGTCHCVGSRGSLWPVHFLFSGTPWMPVFFVAGYMELFCAAQLAFSSTGPLLRLLWSETRS